LWQSKGSQCVDDASIISVPVRVFAAKNLARLSTPSLDCGRVKNLLGRKLPALPAYLPEQE
jgi:hypothetical protein